MNFAFLKDYKPETNNPKSFNTLRKLYEFCTNVEKNTRTCPSDAIINARGALETISKFYKNEHDIKVDGDSLYNIIDACIQSGMGKNSTFEKDTAIIRKTGNNMVHGNPNPKYTTKATEESLSLAMDLTKKLYDVICSILEYNVTFDEDKVPFGDYEIVRKIKKHDGEIVLGDYNYFTKVIGDDGEADEYYYLQCFPQNLEIELNDRRKEAIKEISKSKKRTSYLLKPNRAEKLAEKSDRTLVVYKVWDDSYILSEELYKMNLEQALNVGLDILENLMELKEMQIHHRNIRPGCVIISPLGDFSSDMGFNAYLINMHTSKIEYSNKTVAGKISKIIKESFFTPRVLRTNAIDLSKFNNWEKVDVYSVGKIILYCINPKLCEVDSVDDLVQYDSDFSYDLLDFYDRLFQDDITFSDIPTIEEAREIIIDEIDKLQK